eukprot:6483301-Amphidinium_carterae.1
MEPCEVEHLVGASESSCSGQITHTEIGRVHVRACHAYGLSNHTGKTHQRPEAENVHKDQDEIYKQRKASMMPESSKTH